MKIILRNRSSGEENRIFGYRQRRKKCIFSTSLNNKSKIGKNYRELELHYIIKKSCIGKGIHV